MKTSILKKSLLDYAIKGNLSSKFRKSNPNLNAFNEINAYNAQILKDKKSKEKELKEAESKHKTEKDKELKQILKSQIQTLKKEIAKLKTIAPLNADSAPFPIPPSWVWVRLGDICEISDGTHKTPKYLDCGIPFLSVKNISKGYFDLSDIKYISQDEHTRLISRCKPQKEDILICRIGTLGRAIKINLDLEFSIFVSLGLLQPKIKNIADYLVYYINSASMDKWIENNKVGGGTHAAKLNLSVLEECLIPLPPLQEQKAIVETLDSLITLANTFDKTKEELKRIEKRIEKSLLQYAILGKLSSKFRKSNPSLNAFDEINAYNAQILKDKKSKEKALKELESKLKTEKDKEAKQTLKQTMQNLKKDIARLKTITPLFCNSKIKTLESQSIEKSNFQYKDNASTPPFPIPPSWVWVRLGEVCEIQSGGTPARDKQEFWNNGTIAWVKIADIKSDFVKQTAEYITQQGLNNSSAKIFPKGTLLYTIFATLGETAILNIDASTNQAIAGLSKKYNYETKYLMYYLRSLKDYVNNIGRGMAQNNINQSILKDFLIPLPPLEEQVFIVSQLDTLFTLTKGLNIK